MNTIEKTPKATADRKVRVSMRIPPDLLAAIHEAADLEGITVNDFCVREFEKVAVAAERGIPTAPLAPLIATIRIDDEETCRQIAIEAAAICEEAAALIPALLRIGLETFRERGLRWSLGSEEQAAAGMIAQFRR